MLLWYACNATTVTRSTATATTTTTVITSSDALRAKKNIREQRKCVHRNHILYCLIVSSHGFVPLGFVSLILQYMYEMHANDTCTHTNSRKRRTTEDGIMLERINNLIIQYFGIFCDNIFVISLTTHPLRAQICRFLVQF